MRENEKIAKKVEKDNWKEDKKRRERDKEEEERM